MTILATKPSMPRPRRKKERRSATPRLRFPSQFGDDEEHEKHEGSNAEGHAETRQPAPQTTPASACNPACEHETDIRD
jgi:hypothetical protein